MSKNIKLSKGFDINLAGKAEKKIAEVAKPEVVSIYPSDFLALQMAKVVVEKGQVVKSGTPIFYDKKLEGVMYTSPVSGEVIDVVRGDKRKLLEIKILADKDIDYVDFPKHTISEISGLSREEVIARLTQSGVWTQFIQRPFGVLANPSDSPKAIFVSTFDSHPLAPDYDFVFKGQEKYLQAGIDVLRKLTKGDVHLNLNGKGEVSSVFSGLKNAVLNRFSGAHPAGNVGVQIHHLSPINAGDIVWTLSPYALLQAGKLFLDGIYDGTKIIAVAGSEVVAPQYYKTYIGGSVEKILKNNIKGDINHLRVISGNVLTGRKISATGSLHYYDNMITVIPEGNHARFFLTEGWLAPVASRLSFHRAFGLLSFLSPNKEYRLDTNANGEDRAFVMTGEFEKVVPMDIYPTHLIKAILANDYENMEALGIYEVIEEDLALCEFIDVSKHDIQEILRKGLEMIREN